MVPDFIGQLDGGGSSHKRNCLHLIKEYFPVFGLSTGKVHIFFYLTIF